MDKYNVRIDTGIGMLVVETPNSIVGMENKNGTL